MNMYGAVFSSIYLLWQFPWCLAQVSRVCRTGTRRGGELVERLGYRSWHPEACTRILSATLALLVDTGSLFGFRLFLFRQPAKWNDAASRYVLVDPNKQYQVKILRFRWMSIYFWHAEQHMSDLRVVSTGLRLIRDFWFWILQNSCFEYVFCCSGNFKQNSQLHSHWSCAHSAGCHDRLRVM